MADAQVKIEAKDLLAVIGELTLENRMLRGQIGALMVELQTRTSAPEKAPENRVE